LSFTVIDVDIIKKQVTSAVMISSMYLPIYSHFYTRQANGRKASTFRGYSSL